MQVTLAAISIAAGLCIAAMFTGSSAASALAGIPADMLLAALLIPVAGGVLMFAMAGWQARTSRRNNISDTDIDA
ncbi:MAG: hypothetical protein R3D29_03950 [Nitratireductor sp.]